jgi:hypothetical protein
MLLQNNPTLRPKCEKLLDIINKSDKFIVFNSALNTEEKQSDSASLMLLNTIRLPRNIKDINKILPKSNYTKKRILR